MHLLAMLVMGLLVGALARLLMPGRHAHGLVLTMLLGVAGSIIAAFVGRVLGGSHASTGPGLIASTIGAMVLIWLAHLLTCEQA